MIALLSYSFVLCTSVSGGLGQSWQGDLTTREGTPVSQVLRRFGSRRATDLATVDRRAFHHEVIVIVVVVVAVRVAAPAQFPSCRGLV